MSLTIDNIAVPVVVLALFMIIPLIIGLWAAKQATGTAEDYFIQGRGMGMIPVFFTLAATWWSAYAFLGAAGEFYASGIGYWFAAASEVGFGLTYYILGRRVWHLGKKFGYMTPGDLFADYYESRTLRNVVSILFLVFTIPYLQIQLVGAGYIIETMTNGMLPFWISGLIFYVVIIFYVWVGGLRAVALTDVFYGVLIFGGLFLGGFMIADKFGGVDAVFAKLVVTHSKWYVTPGADGFYTWPMIASMFLTMSIGGVLSLPMWLRMFSVKDAKTFRYSIPFLGIMALGFIGNMLAANCGILDNPSFSTPNNIFPYMLLKYTPILVASLVLAAAAAAAMSTANSQLHAIATVVSWDLYAQSNPKATHEKIINIGRIGLICFASFAYVMALTVPGLLVRIGLIAMAGACQVLPGLVGVLYWRRSTTAGVMAGLIVGSVVTIVATFTSFFSDIFTMHAGMWGLLFNTITFVAVSYCTKTPSESTLKRISEVLEDVPL